MWNSVYSSVFRVMNGVIKQDGVPSPVIVCMYVNEILSNLREKASWMLVQKIFTVRCTMCFARYCSKSFVRLFVSDVDVPWAYVLS